jgi:hypothetical protein
LNIFPEKICKTILRKFIFYNFTIFCEYTLKKVLWMRFLIRFYPNVFCQSLSKVIFWRRNIQHNDIHQNDNYPNEASRLLCCYALHSLYALWTHNILLNTTLLNVILLNTILLCTILIMSFCWMLICWMPFCCIPFCSVTLFSIAFFQMTFC